MRWIHLSNAKRQLIAYCSLHVILTNNNRHDGCELSKLNSKDINLLIKSGTSTKMIISALGLSSSERIKNIN